MQPEVRFNKYNTPWKCVVLSDVFKERHQISTITEEFPQLSFTIAEGVINPEDRKSNKRDFLIKDITTKKYLITCKEDIIYNPANVVHGAIHRNALRNGVVSPIYKIFETNECAAFLEQIVRNPNFIHAMTKFMEGTVLKLRTLKPDSFLGMKVNICEQQDEQEKIALYFHTFDSKIQASAKKIEALKKLKSALLISMFPQNGESTPKVRVNGFSDKWNKVILSDIGKMKAGGTPSTYVKEYWDGDINWLQSGAVKNEIISSSSVTRKITELGMLHSSTFMIKKMSVLIAITGATCANIAYLPFESCANQSVVALEPSNDYDCLFVHYTLLTQRSQILSLKGGSAQSGVSLNALKGVEIFVPCKAEQQKIANLFRSLDKKISLETSRLEKLKQIKSACLNKMFV